MSRVYEALQRSQGESPNPSASPLVTDQPEAAAGSSSSCRGSVGRAPGPSRAGGRELAESASRSGSCIPCPLPNNAW